MGSKKAFELMKPEYSKSKSDKNCVIQPRKKFIHPNTAEKTPKGMAKPNISNLSIEIEES